MGNKEILPFNINNYKNEKKSNFYFLDMKNPLPVNPKNCVHFQECMMEKLKRCILKDIISNTMRIIVEFGSMYFEEIKDIELQHCHTGTEN